MSRVRRYVVFLIGSLGLAFLPMPPGLAGATPERTLYAVFPPADGIILDTHPPAVWAEGPARVVADP